MTSARPAHTGGRRVDLHAHTIFSDGQLSPEELVELAASRPGRPLGVTDHDTVEGITRALAAGEGRVRIVPGIEISSSLDGHDLHVLGYFIDAQSESLLERLASFREERRQRAQAIMERLRELGCPVDEHAVFAAAEPGVVGRPHVAHALVRAGHVPSVEAAFQQYLGPRGRAFVQRPAFHTEEAIACIREAGGASVLAHPGAHLAVHIVERLKDAGLDGIEVWHPVHGGNAVRHWREVAQRLQLIPSGGSDFHGTHRGAGLGDMPVPERTVEQLQAASRR
ncbi:MAG: PHP domain-containing protein [Candidatus Eisenbacteria bacterium]|nr:PHP domain-containing protein [Candidatus Eisenbacteria bacterium]